MKKKANSFYDFSYKLQRWLKKGIEILISIVWFYLDPFIFLFYKLKRLGRFLFFNNFWLEIIRVRWISGKQVWTKFVLLLLLFVSVGLILWGLERLLALILGTLRII